MDKTVIIGAGKTTYHLMKYIKELGYKFSDCFCICLDNDSSLWGTEINGVKIDAVEKIVDYPDTEIVISSIYEKDIRKQLDLLEVQSHIMTNKDYMRRMMVINQIRKYNLVHPMESEKANIDIKQLTVYTVIIGGYDFLHEVEYPDKNIKYVCFTDDTSLHSNTWEVRYVDREFDNPIIESRKYKILPHLFIDTEYSLYIDANIQLKKSPLEYMNRYWVRGDTLLIPHPDRDCIYREAAACILGDKDLAQRLINQVDIYSKCGCPEHAGLFFGGMIGRRHLEKEVIIFEEEWWQHFQKYSRRDQISLGYLIWKNNYEISLADINIYNNIWVAADGKHR